MTPLLDRAYKLRLKRDILRGRNINIQLDIAWYEARNVTYAVEILREYKRKNEIKIDRLNRRIAKIDNKYANKGQHVLNPRKKGEN